MKYDANSRPALTTVKAAALGPCLIGFTKYHNLMETIGTNSGTLHTGGSAAIEESSPADTPTLLGDVTSNEDRRVVIVRPRDLEGVFTWSTAFVNG